ncbi:LuxR C-terminal-related transcriptional regulator [Variovorax sp. JS1663]|uniref:LuxR C-terminal-related transcriptional regulator n=1 Tax=Variovorax sp. JS1663 TaxID=1851577 RepID=UPI000B346EE3|nr:response regulator transcription factor [Variovorax sp. JS1663]OUL99259.1 DNA-binding response regulator [Variovorax sp. JS1663]
MESLPAPSAGTRDRASPWPPSRAILVVDDHDLVRLGVRALVQAQAPSIESTIEVLEAGTVADALALYEEARERIGLVLLDLALPDAEDLGGLARFRARFPDARIVVLSGTDSATLAEGALALGASAFLPKSADLKEVVSFIRACGLLDIDGAVSLPPAPRATAGDHAGPAHRNACAWQELTPRQLEVLQWVLEGKANKEIARLANLSEGTVKNHVSTLLLLFGMRSRAQLISSLR